MKKLALLSAIILSLCYLSIHANTVTDMNVGSFVQDGDWIYYWNKYGDTLCRVRTDGMENTVILNKYSTAYPKGDICYDDKYIYCSKGILDSNNRLLMEGIYRINKEGLEPELVYSNTQIRGIWYIYNDRIVFTDTNDYVYSVRTDGTDLIQLTRANSHCFVGEKGFLYFSDYDDVGIYKINIDGKNKEKISNNKTYYMVIENDWLYYDNRSDDGKMYRMKTDGSENVKINNDDCYFGTINNGWIYYTSGQEDSALCRINGGTLEKQTITKQGYDNLNVVNGYLFYSDDSDMYMVNINGGLPTEAILDKKLFGTKDDLEVLIKGKKLEVADGDTPPMIINDRVLIPARAFSERLNIEVKWDEEKETANFVDTINNGNYMLYTTVTLAKGSNKMEITKTATAVKYENDKNTNDRTKIVSNPWIVSYKEVELDVVIQTVNDRIMVPVRAIAEAFEYKVRWHEDTKTAHVFGWGVKLFTGEARKTQP